MIQDILVFLIFLVAFLFSLRFLIREFWRKEGGGACGGCKACSSKVKFD